MWLKYQGAVNETTKNSLQVYFYAIDLYNRQLSSLMRRKITLVARNPEKMPGTAGSSKAVVGKLSSERYLPFCNAISYPRSRQLSCVTVEGDYAILAVCYYKMQTENC